MDSIYDEIGVTSVINASGSMTYLGGSLIAPEVLEAMDRAADQFVRMDELVAWGGAEIARITGAEAGHVTTGSAGGLLLGTAACLTGLDRKRMYQLPDTTSMKNVMVVQKLHRISFDHACRAAGAKLVEVGDESGTTAEQLKALTDPRADRYDDIAVHYFIQFHLHKQLLDAAEYARAHGVVLKGDIPIGVYRHSVDTWIAPELFNMDVQAGAPPDDFAADGQNWKFPTYNWHVMAENGYAWWQARLKQMATYFDAFRIDHILGFFRIWQIPGDQVQGIMGHFHPSIPFHPAELEVRGLHWDPVRYCEPYIRQHLLGARFGKETETVIRECLEETRPGCYRMKPGFRTQRQVVGELKTRRPTRRPGTSTFGTGCWHCSERFSF